MGGGDGGSGRPAAGQDKVWESEVTSTGSDELPGIGIVPRQQIHRLDIPISSVWLPIEYIFVGLWRLRGIMEI